MVRVVAIFLILIGSGPVWAQRDSVLSAPQIVLLKNDNQLLPLKDLDSLNIGYKNNSELEKLGRRYTENEGPNELLISSINDNTSSSGSGIAIIFGAGLTFDSLLLNGYEAIIYSESDDSRQLDLITQMIFGGRAFTDT